MNTTKILILAIVVTLAGCSKKDKEYDATGTFGEATEISVSCRTKRSSVVAIQRG